MPSDFVRTKAWFLYLDETQKELVNLAYDLWKRERLLKSQFDDYSFVVFPMAKAYEGFLKKFFFDMGLVTDHELASKHFRIGRALNPNLKNYYQDEKWIYDDVTRLCGEQIAQLLWQAWSQCRNHLFHYFTDQPMLINLSKAGEKLDQLSLAMEQAVSCKLLT